MPCAQPGHHCICKYCQHGPPAQLNPGNEGHHAKKARGSGRHGWLWRGGKSGCDSRIRGINHLGNSRNVEPFFDLGDGLGQPEHVSADFALSALPRQRRRDGVDLPAVITGHAKRQLSSQRTSVSEPEVLDSSIILKNGEFGRAFPQLGCSFHPVLL